MGIIKKKEEERDRASCFLSPSQLQSEEIHLRTQMLDHKLWLKTLVWCIKQFSSNSVVFRVNNEMKRHLSSVVFFIFTGVWTANGNVMIHE